jgi:hypothetical protein
VNIDRGISQYVRQSTRDQRVTQMCMQHFADLANVVNYAMQFHPSTGYGQVAQIVQLLVRKEFAIDHCIVVIAANAIPRMVSNTIARFLRVVAQSQPSHPDTKPPQLSLRGL